MSLSTYMQGVTGVLCAIFGILTSSQITETENANGETLKDDALFNKCINQAKSSAAIREKIYKDVLVDESIRKKMKHSESVQAAVQQGRAVPNVTLGQG